MPVSSLVRKALGLFLLLAAALLTTAGAQVVLGGGDDVTEIPPRPERGAQNTP